MLLDSAVERQQQQTTGAASKWPSSLCCAGPQRGMEGDFQFSSLKRKWQEEEGKFLSGELRRAQDLCVQQEMELESLRQQVAALSRMLSQVAPAPSCGLPLE